MAAFGQSSSSPFGSPSVFGQTNNASNNPFAPKPFGSSTPFGSQTGGSLFGGTSTGVFGAAQSSSPFSSTTTFGASSSPAFGNTMPAFGASSTPAFGSSSSSFGGMSNAVFDLSNLFHSSTVTQ
jgi:nuclear pore complex protein Nup98-Nup96